MTSLRTSEDKVPHSQYRECQYATIYKTDNRYRNTNTPHTDRRSTNNENRHHDMFFQHRILSSLISFIFAVAAASSTKHKHQPAKNIASTEEYLATAAATNRLGECLPTSIDDDTYHCFANLRAVATGTGTSIRTNFSSSTSIKYVHHDECFDDDVDACPGWAEYGECHSNPDYMLVHCRYSCQTCTSIVDGHGGIVQVAPGSSELRHSIAQHITETAHYIRRIQKQNPRAYPSCRNHDADCSYKAVQGQCTLGSDTASWMHQHCPAACRTCGV